MDEFDEPKNFAESVHRVLGEHRGTRIQFMREWLDEHCDCSIKHKPDMVEGSLEVCPPAQAETEMRCADGVLWALGDIHATLFPDHDDGTGGLN